MKKKIENRIFELKSCLMNQGLDWCSEDDKIGLMIIGLLEVYNEDLVKIAINEELKKQEKK